MANHGFAEGQSIGYGNLTGTDDTDIPGLTIGTQYFVHVVDANNIQLRKARKPSRPATS